MLKPLGATLLLLALVPAGPASAQPDPRLQAQARGVPVPGGQAMPRLAIPSRTADAAAIAAARALSVTPGQAGAQAAADDLPQAPAGALAPQPARMPAGAAGLRPNRLGDPVVPDDLRALLPNGVGPTPDPDERPTLLAPDALRPAPDPTLLATSDRTACLRHIDEAEHRFQIPRGILRSIAYVESSWGGAPWPWTMNAGGRSYYFRTQAEAIQAATLPGGQLRSGDLGCMQINTRWHGQRFRGAGHMLDPRTNVLYAGWYLRTLYLQHGSWHEAVARYHSSQGVHQRAYLCRVVSVRIRLGMQTPNRWFAQTCPGGMETYLAWARFQR
jgi:hypothetical protein